MSKPVGRMTFGRTLTPAFVVADSSFELVIKDAKDIESGITIKSDQISLMDFSDSSWTITVHNNGSYTYFYADLQKFPEELKSKSKAVFSVSCGGRAVSSYSCGSVRDSKISHQSNCNTSSLKGFSVNNSLTLLFRLVITCDGASNLRKKFYDPVCAKQAFVNNLSSIFGDPTFSDFTFIVGDREFKVHMNILAAASPVMRKMFTSNLKEAKTRKCRTDALDPEIFDHLLRFIYKCELPEDLKAVARPLYEAAHYYEVESLKSSCIEEIQESLSPDTSMEIFEWVQPYDLEKLKMDAWTTVKRDILQVYVKLKNEPMSLEQVQALIMQREQEKNFWDELKEEVNGKDDKVR